MKIISGKYKGRILKGFDLEGTRPTMDRVKESLFAMIQDKLLDASVLDLYAGSGNLAIEALSNGAKKAYLVDNSVQAINVIKSNLKLFKIDNSVVIKADAISTLNKFICDNITFNLIFLDPPYASDELLKVLSFIDKNINLLNDGGLIACETEKDIDASTYKNLSLYKKRNYGSKKVIILRKSVNNN